MHGKTSPKKNLHDHTMFVHILIQTSIQNKRMNHCFANAFTVPSTSNQTFPSRDIHPLEIGSGEPWLSMWSLRKQADASDACFWSAGSSVCSAASTVASGVRSVDGSVSFPSSSDTSFDLERNLAYWSRGEQKYADAASHSSDSERGWRRCADTQSEKRDRVVFEDTRPTKRAARPENIARSCCTLETNLPGSFEDHRQRPVLEEYSLGPGDPYASGEFF